MGSIGYLTSATISSLAPALQRRAINAPSLLEMCLEKIAAQNDVLHAFITVSSAAAREEALAAEREIASGRYRGPLHGIPISVKDMIDVHGSPTTAASRVRGTRPAAHDATVVQRLRRAGAIMIGKCNLHEFAYGSTSEESAFGAVRNPRDISRVPGGSSGGSAAAVVADMCLASIGTDTGGSVRIPAAACGIVGFKPTYGELPCHGVVPLSPSLDTVGPLAKTVEDAWLVYRAMAGESAPTPVPSVKTRPRLAVLRQYFCEILDEPVERAFNDALARLESAGAHLETRQLPSAEDIGRVYSTIIGAEAFSYHRDLLASHANDYTKDVRERLEVARSISEHDYNDALVSRTRLQSEVERALDGCDAFVLPTMPIVAPYLNSPSVVVKGQTVKLTVLMRRLTPIFNLTGQPAISIPGPVTQTALPWGLQLAGRTELVRDLFGVARFAEQTIRSDASALG